MINFIFDIKMEPNQLVGTITIILVWTILVISSLIIFYQSRRALAIRVRGFSLTIMLAITQWLMVIWSGIAMFVGNQLPCDLNLWIPGILIPLWSACLLTRFIRIIFLHRVNQYRLRQSSKSDSDLSNNPKLDTWLNENRSWFASNGLTLILIGFFFFNVVLTLLLHILPILNQPNTVQCPQPWQDIPYITISGLFLMLEWPVFLILFNDVQESFGVKLESTLHLIIAPLALVSEVVASFLASTQPTLSMILHAVSIALIIVVHLLTVGYPVWWARHEFALFHRLKNLVSIQEARRSLLIQDARTLVHTEPTLTLATVLAHPLLLTDFRKYAAHNFCIENVLFYDQLQHIRFQSTTPIPYPLHALRLYQDFIAPDAPLQLNLTSATRRHLSTQIELGHFHPEMYQPAWEEIYSLLSQDVFPRYRKAVAHHHPSS